MPRIPTLLTALLLAGCILGTSDARVNVGIEYTLVDSVPTGDPNILLTGTVLQLHHHFATPTPCYDFSNSATQRGTTIELVLTQTAAVVAGCTGTTVAYWTYSAVINGVQSGTRTIALTYDTDGSAVRTEYPIPAGP